MRNFFYKLAFLFLFTVSFENSAHSYSDSECESQRKEIDINLKTSELSYMNIADAVLLKNGERYYLNITENPRSIKWSKENKQAILSAEFNNETILNMANNVKVNLTKEKKVKISKDIVLEAKRLLPESQRVLIHDLNSDSLKNFKGLNYFKCSKKHVVQATFKKYDKFIKTELESSDGSTYEFNKAGIISFKYNGHKAKLSAYTLDQPENLKTIALFFRDASNSNSTYSAGRNLEIELSSPKQKNVVLDFNQTFNPYCARTKYSRCALAQDPKLDFSIEAGEKKP